MHSHYPFKANTVIAQDVVTDAYIHLFRVKSDICLVHLSPTEVVLEDSSGQQLTGTKSAEQGLFMLTDSGGVSSGVLRASPVTTHNFPYGVLTFVTKALVMYNSDVVRSINNATGVLSIVGGPGIAVTTTESGQLRIDAVGSQTGLDCLPSPAILKGLHIKVSPGPRPLEASTPTGNTIALYTPYATSETCGNNKTIEMPNAAGVIARDSIDHCEEVEPCAYNNLGFEDTVWVTQGVLDIIDTGSALNIVPDAINNTMTIMIR